MIVTYRALARCHIGRLREPGEEFLWERFSPCPAHLVELDDTDAGTSVPGTTGTHERGADDGETDHESEAGLKASGSKNRGPDSGAKRSRESAKPESSRLKASVKGTGKGAAQGTGKRTGTSAGKSSGAKAGKAVTTSAGASHEDMGGGEPVCSSSVTSFDMIR